MSQRGAFVTEYVYCAACETVLSDVLLRERTKSLCCTQVPSWEDGGGKTMPIFAGKLGSTADEVVDFEFSDEMAELEKRLCHTVMFACLGESQEVRVLVAGNAHGHANPSPPPSHPPRRPA